MTDSTRFETRLTDALARYADRVPVEVDPDRVVQSIAGRPSSTRTRPQLALALIVTAVALAASVALFGGRLLAPVPPVVVSPSPSVPAATSSPAPTATTSPTPVLTPSPAATPIAILNWTEHDIGSQPAITSIWRVGEWFVAAGPESGFSDDDQHRDAAFIRSRDGRDWESVPAPARGMEVETGAVDGDVLWLVGRRGSSADPQRGIWTTRDGATWERVANVEGLDFGPGRVDVISRASAGWLGIARRWIDAEAQEGFLLRSTDGVAWTKLPYPDVGEPYYGSSGLASDGEQWLMVVGRTPVSGTEVWALTSTNGTDWSETRVAELARGPAPGDMIGADATTFGPGGFVIVGQQLDGEYPHPVAWVSRDGGSWTQAAMSGLPDPAGETGLRSVVAFDGGYLASGYRLEDTPSFWTSVDGASWTQVDDLFGSTPADVDALAASDTTFVAGGQARDGDAFLWTAPH